MTLSECVLPRTKGREVLLSTYTRHPSQASNELSGQLVAAALNARLARWPTRRLGHGSCWHRRPLWPSLTLCSAANT